MRSSFFEFNVATSALFVARGGLDTVSHNVSNASTKGYSRQVIEQRATTPLTFYNGKGMVGTGAEIFGVNQVRNFYLDKKYWSESSVLGEYSTKSTLLSLTERVFNELSGTGLTAQFTDFFNQMKDLATSANDKTFRTNVTQLGTSMTTFLKNTYDALKKQQRDINTDVKATVNIINSIGQQIRSLNDQIITFELDGSRANDLRDARANLVDELSKFVNVEVSEIERNEEYAAGKYPEPENRGKSQKEFVVMINGHDFVKGSQLETLVCKERKTTDASGNAVNVYYNPEDNAGLYDIYWAISNTKFDVYSPSLKGELKGLIEVRDGNNANYIKNATTKSYNSTTGELIIDIPAGSRVDLNTAGGKISVFDPATGRAVDYQYTSYTYDPATNQAKVMIANPKTTDLFNAAGAKLSLGETSSYKGIPYYMSRLNDLVRTFAKAINEGKYMNGGSIPGVTGHIDGYNLKGDNLRTLFFTYKDKDGNEISIDDPKYNIYNMTADNIFVNSELLAKPELLAASIGSTIGQSDNKVILGFSKIMEDSSLFLEGNIKDYIIGMTGELGIDLNQAKKFTKNYTDVTKTIDNQRTSVSGVSIDEEMISMIKYQQQYQAAAKLINIIDSIYDMTINRLGV